MDNSAMQAIAVIETQMAQKDQKIAALEASVAAHTAQLATLTAEVNRLYAVLRGA